MSAGEWIAAIAVLVAMATTAAGMFRYVLTRINETREENLRAIAELHSRVNAVRDEYVRRDDLMTHVQAIERSITALLNEVQRVHNRIDRLYTAAPPTAAAPCAPTKR